MAGARAYEEVIDFLAAGSTPRSVLEFQPSETAKRRMRDLVAREKTDGLTADEASELDLYLQLEHIFRLAKVRARQHISAATEKVNSA